MFHPGFCDVGRKLFFKQRFHLEHYPADYVGATACSALQIRRAVESARFRWVNFLGATLANLVTRETKCRRITVRPWHGRYSLSGDSSKRILVAGCSE